MRSFVPCRSPARHSLSRSLRSPESPTSRSSSLLIKPYTQQQPRQQQCEIRRLASRKPAYQPLYFEIRRLARSMSTQPTAGAVAGHGGRAIGDTDELKLVNRLGESRSPYVRGHMSNPVAWQMWSPEALALAKKHNRLIFVSIGYAACHCMLERISETAYGLKADHNAPSRVSRHGAGIL
jgi:hypothetical protein